MGGIPPLHGYKFVLEFEYKILVISVIKVVESKFH